MVGGSGSCDSGVEAEEFHCALSRVQRWRRCGQVYKGVGRNHAIHDLETGLGIQTL